ncbi:hypothetical protein SBA4_2120027 [Candidatus Sulfopaludibacter sp. SbA4]|nr:hypothetical protein SBA4_2120027 [Candidatus Sulfopaludibacter sp. SbA4]
MGRLAGFRYREIVRKLKVFGFQFDREAAGMKSGTTPGHSQAGGDRSGFLPGGLTVV